MIIHFFGSLGERIGRRVELALPEDVRDVAELRRLLIAQHPAAAEELSRTSVRAAVGDAIVEDSFPLAGAEQVDFLPPLSGG